MHPLPPRTVGQMSSPSRQSIISRLKSSPPSPQGLKMEACLEELAVNMERLSYAFDAVPPRHWLCALPDDLCQRIAAEWTPGPHALLHLLGYARDEEAYVFGRGA